MGIYAQPHPLSFRASETSVGIYPLTSPAVLTMKKQGCQKVYFLTPLFMPLLYARFPYFASVFAVIFHKYIQCVC